ncbi:prephenate dehydrogenase [Aeribacillus sp. FSL K6-2848]|uniref:prephenate dehydrogenase n=1 Tax=Aeribacillus TaxID=1055323 RepID=UPI00119C6B4E|nr:prephenate dehydrogenase [Aeribacillus composti]TVZ79151.1 prephenate dehydrogenase [Aeribacillus composti]
MEKVFIIGLGLIGGSISRAIKKEHPSVQLVGYDINNDQVQMAKKLGIIDQSAESIKEGAESADVIIISTPVEQTLNVLTFLGELSLKEGVIITDVGSTKKKIVDHASVSLPKTVTFIGGHPMAGSHKSGVAAAKTHLFENAFYILTPGSNERPEKIEQLKKLLKGTKAQFIVMTPEEHDSITGVISHFPHLIAASLVHQAEKKEEMFPIIKRLAAGGFRDITRIASSNPVMWRDIIVHNHDVLIELFDEWIQEMKQIKQFIEKLDKEQLYTYFEKAKTYRDGLPEREKGAIPSFYDLYVDVPDYPGVISEITGYLAKEEISITNIRILETREEIFGVLRISFQSDEDRMKAKQCIDRYTNYETYIL